MTRKFVVPIDTPAVQYNTASTETNAVGKLVWNDEDGTLNLGLKGGNVTLQLGQEQVLRVVNGTGADLTEAAYKVVRVTGAQGQRPQVLLAQANTEAGSVDTIGVVTETILNNQEGFITTNGIVRGINTTGSLQSETWADGDVLYLSATVAGGLTKTRPSAPNHAVVVAIVIHAHATQGKLFVKVDNGYELEELHDVLFSSVADGEFIQRENSLWVNKTADEAGLMTFHGFVVPYEVTLTYDETTRTFTLTPTGATFDVWILGKKYTKTGVQTFTHADTTGDHFVYYDSTGTLATSSTPWDFKVVAPVGYVYYNSTLNIGYALFELHTFKRNLEWHESQHFAIGTFVRSGFAISGVTLNTSTNDAVTPLFAAGVIVDEDIEYNIAQVNDGGPYTILRRTGASDFTWDSTNTFPYLYGGTYIQYNQFTGGAWQMTELVSARWVNYYVYATTALDSAKRLYIVPAQAVHTSLALAQAESVSSLNLDGFGLTEFVPIYKLTFNAQSTYTTVTGRVRLVAVERLTNTRGSLALSLSSTLHNTLTGRSDADSHPISAITDLQTTLDGKLAVGGTAGSVDDLNSVNPVYTWIGTQAQYNALGTWSNYTEYWITDAAAGGSGTVTSVALSLPAELTVSGSPVTGSGTLSAVWADQTTQLVSGNIMGKVFAGPSAGSAAPTFRTLASGDIPILAQSKITGLVDDIAASKKVQLTLSNANVTLAQADSGKGYYKDNTTAYTYTIPDGLEAGTIVTLANIGSAGNITVSMSGSDVLRLSGTTTTGSRTIAPYSEGTFHKVNASTWLAAGQGVT